MKKLKLYFWYFISFAFIGWVYEVLYYLFEKGKFINSGTMIGPWLPIYGWGGLLIYFLSLKLRDKPYKVFIISFLLSGIIEYLTSLYLEYVYGMKWWDYSKMAFNINGRICLAGLLVFSILALIVMYFVLPLLDKIYNKLNPKIINIILLSIFLIYAFDFVYSTIHPNKNIASPIEIVEQYKSA